LGRQFEVLKNTFKPYAACLFTHPTIDAVLQLRNRHKLSPDQVQQIRCEVARGCMDAAAQAEPKTALAGKFSVYYAAALALAEGEAGEELFTDQRVLSPKMVALRKRVKASGSPSLKSTEARVTILTKDGKKYAAFINCPKGDPRNPPTDGELEKKFRNLMSLRYSSKKVDSLVDQIWNLEKVKNIRRFIRLLD
jgi:2-methylcitrate dehydratase PrpD